MPPPASCSTTCPPLHPLDGTGQFGAELIIVHRLQHIIQCIHLVAPDGILCHVGHKDQHHIRIHGPDGFGCSKAVQPWHLHVHKNDVESRRIVLCDLSTVCDETDLHLQALLLRILPDEPVQAFPCFFLILYDRNFEHPAPTFSLRLIAVWLFLLKHTFL